MSELLVILNAIYTTIIGIMLKIEHEQHRTQLELSKLECEKRMREACEAEMNWRLAQMREWVDAEIRKRQEDRKYWTEVDRRELEKKECK
jgi:predicted Holliday junction resolvase-like endonuclease